MTAAVKIANTIMTKVEYQSIIQGPKLKSP